MFKVKICGVLLKVDIAAVEDSTADAVGFNFFPPSIRYLDPDLPAAQELNRAARAAGLARIGVFVNLGPSEVVRIASTLDLDFIQLHGDELPESVDPLLATGRGLIRAIKLPAGPLDAELVAARARPWVSIGASLLLDVDAGQAYGGSGRRLDWQSVGQWAAAHPGVTWGLAGGLNVDNVAAAIVRTGASCVDVASGVEQPRGRKSPKLISQFAQLATNQFDEREQATAN